MAYIAIAVVCVIIFVKAFYIQQVQGSMWRGMSDSLHLKMQPIDADRGTIYSDDGQMLSTSVPQFDIYVDFGADGLRQKNGELFYRNLDSLSYCLADLFKDKTQSAYKKILSTGYKKKDRYYLLKRKVSFQDYYKLRQFPLVRLGKNTSGFIAETKNIRLNPYQLLAYRTIGLERANAQKVGLEQTYDTVLRGEEGKRLVRFISGGVAVPVNNENEIEPENGKDIVTTLDTRIQEIAENALMKMLVQSESQYGTCVVMETQTGQVKAMANLGQRPDGSYWEDYNYALRATEPGSTIKLATLLAVLSEGKTSINDLVEVGSTGNAFVGVRNVNDAERAPKPVMTVRECFAHSSNVGMSKIAYNAFGSQPDKFAKYLHQLRMDTLTGIDLKGEEKPRIAKTKRNKEGLSDMITMSFGYALQVTPMQTLTLYNAIANNGKMVRPYLVSSIQSDGIVYRQIEPAVINEQIVEPRIVKDAQNCMKAVVTEGTAKLIFRDAPYTVAGKTGTAHVADGVHGYDDGIYQASFVGYFPADKPQYTCIVVIKTKPHAPLHYGGQLSAPVFKEVADRLYSMFIKDNMQYATATQNDSINYIYAGAVKDVKEIMQTIGVKYKDSSAKKAQYAMVSKGDTQPVIKTQAISNKTMPQLSGMTLKDAVLACESMGLKVNVQGKGRVVIQSLLAGQTVKQGQQVSIQLN
ncbi:penicillin-binding protein [Panacibacter ginsenosidivorans]|nr:penicillin-binding protein [Panacibacter ginsenosidivorans]